MAIRASMGRIYRCAVCNSSDLQEEERENGAIFCTCLSCGHQGVARDSYDD